MTHTQVRAEAALEAKQMLMKMQEERQASEEALQAEAVAERRALEKKWRGEVEERVAKAVKKALDEQARGHKEELHKGERRLQQALKAAQEAEAEAEARRQAMAAGVGEEAEGAATGAGDVGPAARERVEEVRALVGGVGWGIVAFYLCVMEETNADIDGWMKFN